MTKYILQRIAFAILTLFIISILTFCLIAAFAPNPVKQLAEEGWTKLHDKSGYAGFSDYLAREEVKYGLRYLALDGQPGDYVPIIVRYFKYIGGLFAGDYGQIIKPTSNPNPVVYTSIPILFFKPLKYSIMITLPSFVISSILGITLGVVAGYNRGKWIDSSINIFVVVFIALPSFIIAPIVITLFVKVGLPPKVFTIEEQSITEVMKSMVPPILVITLGSLAGFTTYTRNQIVTVLTSNYVLIAKTKGLSRTSIFFKYILRNISIPIFTMLIYSFMGLLTGSIIIEKFWNIQGTSMVITYAFPNGEIYIEMFSIIFFTALSLILEIFVDVCYAILDPKITFGTTSKRNYFLFFKAWTIRKKLINEYNLSKQKQSGTKSGVKA
ncbi:oligopeptide ABC transporter permease [Metamycoplasma cloacale]|uniref:ABC transporter permease n=1 Tax=Metamycoplasma cloacale TaxID=92401 RepID=A0A2Z4LMX4_9BACT|nr:ABC transporter permease [Metamycoplasma cloacale]AWX42587.1 ABC transporter permease [Metamycoplasma cloacale]VEU79690.1 oligopeptide ABC transporter permease [Metamycoplasma cloacale]